MNTMKTTIDAAGRVVIPKAVRIEAALEPGMDLMVRCRDGRVEIEPVPLPVKLVKRGHFLIAEPRVRVPPLSHETVERTRDRVRRERERGE
jgi:AbrB family looped-hinge helix DNA binding protein